MSFSMFFPDFPSGNGRGFGLYDTEGYGVYMLSFESYEAPGHLETEINGDGGDWNMAGLFVPYTIW